MMMKIYSLGSRQLKREHTPSSSSRPTAYIVMGNASQNAAVIDVLQKETTPVTHKVEHKTIEQAAAHQQNILININDLKHESIQSKIGLVHCFGHSWPFLAKHPTN